MVLQYDRTQLVFPTKMSEVSESSFLSASICLAVNETELPSADIIVALPSAPRTIEWIAFGSSADLEAAFTPSAASRVATIASGSVRNDLFAFNESLFLFKMFWTPSLLQKSIHFSSSQIAAEGHGGRIKSKNLEKLS